MIFPENNKLLTATNWSLVCIPEAATVWQRWCGGGIGDLGNNQQWDAGVPGDCCWAFSQKKLAVSVLHLEQPTVRGELPGPFVFWI